MKKFYDNHISIVPPLLPGMLVWLSTKNLNTNHPSKKLDNKRLGPFEILEPVGQGAYHLKLPDCWRIHNVFNESFLSCYIPGEYPSQKLLLKLPPLVIDDQNEYEVEDILDAWYFNKMLKFLVKWKGYPCEENTWELQLHLKNAVEIINDYLQCHPVTLPTTKRGLCTHGH
jgi:hypothetical protein